MLIGVKPMPAKSGGRGKSNSPMAVVAEHER
jgi:hypothetical protein